MFSKKLERKIFLEDLGCNIFQNFVSHLDEIYHLFLQNFNQ